MNILEIAKLVRKTLEDKKGEDIKIVQIGDKTTIADYMILGTASNERLLSALSNEVEDELFKLGILPKNIEGKKESGWILMDFGDIIVNILTRDMREKYDIEKVWMDCTVIE